MSVEQIRKVFEEELGPELRKRHKVLSSLRKRLGLREEIERIRLGTEIRRIESIQYFHTLETRISALEAATIPSP
jgi:hypothetical protein